MNYEQHKRASGSGVDKTLERLSAILDACEGISTEAIKANGLMLRQAGAMVIHDGGHVLVGEPESVQHVAELIKQRDALLDIMHRAVDDQDNCPEWLDDARSTIAWIMRSGK